ncbi:hypothetical protein JX266_007695 [Neoarthrinium moseri]|nr:hypothetical protein JX266_007695 [Neoarthrinium moseri]
MAFRKPQFLREMTIRMLRIYLFASIGAMNFGYDNNWWSGVIGAQSFIDHYGRDNGPNNPRTLPSSWLSAASGTPIAGWIVGCLTAGYVTSKFGRKKTMVIICLIALVGMVIQCAVRNYWALMVGRLINAVSMGIEANTVPMYMAELAPASIRGGLVNFYQTWLYVGAILASALVYASTKHFQGQWAYMLPIFVQLLPPVMLLCSVWFIPESPRWLLQKGRRDAAHKAFFYIHEHSATKDQIALELDTIEQAMILESENHRATSYTDCFKGSNARRSLVAIGVQTLQQAQGNSFFTSYLVIFLKQVGVQEPQLIACAKICCCLAGCFAAFYLTDKIGRRPMLMGGSFFMAGLMMTVSGLASWTPGGVSGASAQGCIAAILLHGVFSAATWGSTMWTVTTEVATTQLRERTIALATVIGFVASLLITYINPFIQNEPGNLGTRVGMIYGSISLLSMAFVFLFVPEMKYKSLEELDQLFHANIPAWRSHHFVITASTTKISDIEAPELDDPTKVDKVTYKNARDAKLAKTTASES